MGWVVVRSSKREDSLLLTGLAGACVILLVLALYMTRQNSDNLLRKEAETTAVGWADYLGSSLKNVEDIFEGRELGLENRWFLKHMENVGDIFLYKFFDLNGVLQLTSSKLDGAYAKSADKSHNGNETAKTALLKGEPSTFVKMGTPNRPNVYSESYVPIIKNGRLIGVIEVYVDQTARAALIQKSFTKLALAIATLMALGFWLAVIIIVGKMRQKKRAEEHVNFLANHDPLTGFLNRASFNEALFEATNDPQRSSAQSLALLSLDLKGLRDINDTYSIKIGDQLIKEVGLRLKTLISDSDIVCRFAGDEFAILRIGDHARPEIDAFADLLANALNTVYEISDNQIVSGVHIGIVFTTANELSSKEFINCVETAKIRAKANSHLQYCYFERSMAAEIQVRKTLESNLRRAMTDKQQFQVFYQPQFALDAGKLRGYESLIRWNHPEKGLISPADFIPIAEDTGLICELGDWVLNQACQQAVSWPAPFIVAVNVSPVQFRQDNFLANVVEALERSGLNPTRLEIEITESVLFKNAAQAIALLHDLKALGVRIAMDDFGTGFSSLTHLWQFPFDNIKIDKSFIQNVCSNSKVQKIVSSIIELGYALGTMTTAEGVETLEQETFLRGLNCEIVQGFRYGRPVPPEQLTFEHSLAIAAGSLKDIARQGQKSDLTIHVSTMDVTAACSTGKA